MNRIAFVALAFATTSSLAGLTGCLDDGQDIDEASLDSVESDITIVPVAGRWVYGALNPVSTNCSVPGIVQGESGPFNIDTVTTTSLRVIPNDGTGPFSCTYANASFNCPQRAVFTRDLRPSVQAVLTVRITATGLMSDSRHALGKQDAAVSCVGTQCNTLGAMPCGFVENFEVHTP